MFDFSFSYYCLHLITLYFVGLSRIVGPQCVVSCLELQIAVPNVPHPINNIAMQDVVVSCSSIEKAQRVSFCQGKCNDSTRFFILYLKYLLCGTLTCVVMFLTESLGLTCNQIYSCS